MREQTGFVSQCGTSVNITRLLDRIAQADRKDELDLIFIDYKSAYNTIRRNLLYEILQNKQILEDVEIQCLKSLHSMLHYKSEGQRYWFSNGVPQGSPISPALFNIYMERLVDRVRAISGIQFQCYLYADDAAFVVKHWCVEHFLEKLKLVSDEMSLSINQNKSGIMRIKTKCNVKDIAGYPILEEYLYLGIKINNYGKIDCHLAMIKKRVNYLQTKLGFVGSGLGFANKLLLWKVFVMPYFLYLCPALDSSQKKTIISQISKLWRKSLKRVSGLPQCTPNEVINRLAGDLEHWIKYFHKKVKHRIQ